MSYKVVFNDQIQIFEKPEPIAKIVGNNKDIICAYVNNRIRELTYVVDKDCTIVPLTCKDRDAKPTYDASLRFLAAMAMKNIFPDYQIRYSYNVSRSIFIQFLDEDHVSNVQMVKALEKEMKRLVDLDLPFERLKVSKEEAKKVFEKEGYIDKVDVIPYRPEKNCHLYKCDNYYNYMYNRMVPSTSYVSKFNLIYYPPGIIIQYPRFDCNGQIPPFEPAPTFGKTLKEAHVWAKITNADSVVGINQKIEKDGIVDFINLSEARHNRQLTELGDTIEEDKENIRLICIAGPSSSGKTTFANRLRIELLSRGIQPIRISIDDYYLTKDQAPKNPDGTPDLESIDALDIKLFNENMADLIAGLEVTLPSFNFKTGKREVGRTLKVGHDQPIIIEGIHALNSILTSSIPNFQKYKIFIAPQAQVNIDNHNPLSLTDLRLLRRIVRDHQFRNTPAEDTIAMWPSVRKGEFTWIYKTQENADYVFNSLLPYEFCALKKYALPLLEKIGVESEYFPVAERLIRMMKFFVDMPDDWIPCNSLIREFIGGSCYADV